MFVDDDKVISRRIAVLKLLQIEAAAEGSVLVVFPGFISNDEYADNMLYYSDLNGTEIIVNMREISLIELPLVKTEDAICAGFLDE